MFSALKKLTRGGDDRCAPPMPMSSSLQKRFSRGVHFNMKILIKGDRNVGKSCLLQRLQGGAFTEEYVPTEQIQVAPIHWTYKNSDYIVKVEVWEVVDKGRAKKKPPLGLKLENQSAASQPDEEVEVPVLDATFLDVYKNATGVILMMDITKPWTFEYAVKELSRIPADLPVVLLGNHCDMQHHRQVQSHHIEQALQHAKIVRSAPVRYAESSMRNGFGLRLLHKFLSIPFLRLQRTSLLEQLQRNQKDMEEIEKELDEFQCSEEAHYTVFVDRLANKRRQGAPEPRLSNERAPSIVLGAGKPIIPPSVNPLLAQSLSTPQQTQYVSPELLRSKPPVSMDMTPTKSQLQDSVASTPSGATGSTGALDEFYAGALDTSFLDDLTPVTFHQDTVYDTDSDEESTINPKVTLEEDDLGDELAQSVREPQRIDETGLRQVFLRQATLASESEHAREHAPAEYAPDEYAPAEYAPAKYAPAEFAPAKYAPAEYAPWAGDGVRRSPEGGEDPDQLQETEQKEKKHKKKKSKDKDRGDYSEKSEKKEKKHRRRKSKSEKPNPQADLLAPSGDVGINYDDYDSI